MVFVVVGPVIPAEDNEPEPVVEIFPVVEIVMLAARHFRQLMRMLKSCSMP